MIIFFPCTVLTSVQCRNLRVFCETNLLLFHPRKKKILKKTSLILVSSFCTCCMSITFKLKGKNVVKEMLLTFKKLSSLIRHYFIHGCFVSSFTRKLYAIKYFRYWVISYLSITLETFISTNLIISTLLKLFLLTFYMYFKKKRMWWLTLNACFYHNSAIFFNIWHILLFFHR